MDNQKLVLIGIGALGGLGAFHVYEQSGLATAFATLLIITWIMFNLRTKMGVLGGLGNLLNPLHTGFTFLIGGFAYAAFTGENFMSSLYFSIGTFFLGMLFSFVVFKYWNIGP